MCQEGRLVILGDGTFWECLYRLKMHDSIEIVIAFSK